MEIEKIPAKPLEKKLLRVAAYARVSSDKDAAFHSLEAQTAYYEEYVFAHSDWELVGIYSDNGISGTIINRPEFQRLIEDCRAGKIDLVVTKSITRFARNTVVLLETIRELKALGIDCYFEKEDMHSISPDGELLLTLLAMYAEEEARSASENQKWRIRKLFEQGKLPGGKRYGYKLVDNVLQIVPEEAEVIRQIFEHYLSGWGCTKIARALTEAGIPAPYGGTWSHASVRDILQNEKYAGNLLLQKTFREDFRTKRKRKNTGELPKYNVRNSHVPIVSHATFDRVQAELSRRSIINHDQGEKRQGSEKLFKGLIICGICGKRYVHKYASGRTHNRPIWICTTYNNLGKDCCDSQYIPESVLIETTMNVLGEASLSRQLIMEKIARIDVPRHNHLIYHLTDGTIADTPWTHKSRRDSWTDEMRQAAREKALERQRKDLK